MPRTARFQWRRTTAALAVGAVSSLLIGMLATTAPASASPSPSWTTPQPVAPSGAARNIAAVSLPGNKEAVFWVPQNGSLQEMTRYTGNGGVSVGYHQVEPPGSAAPSADIAAVNTGPTLDVVWVGSNGSVTHAYSTDGGEGWAPASEVPYPSASLSASLAVVSIRSGSWEVFWEAPNGGIETDFCDGDPYCGSGGPDTAVLVAPSSSTPRLVPRQITAVSRALDMVDLLWIGADGSVHDYNYYYDYGFELDGYTTLAPAGSAYAGSGGAITAVSQASYAMEVWWIGADNSVQDRHYNGAAWNGFTLAGAGSAKNAIASVAQSATVMNVAWTGWATNSVQDATFGPSSQLQIAPGGRNYNNGGIATVSRSDGTVDVFWVTSNGAIEMASESVPPTITGPDPEPAYVGAPYLYQFTMTGMPTPVVTSAKLPPGMQISGDGTVTGTPTALGTYPITVTATNSAGSATDSFNLTVSRPPPPPPPPHCHPLCQ